MVDHRKLIQYSKIECYFLYKYYQSFLRIDTENPANPSLDSILKMLPTPLPRPPKLYQPSQRSLPKPCQPPPGFDPKNATSPSFLPSFQKPCQPLPGFDPKNATNPSFLPNLQKPCEPPPGLNPKNATSPPYTVFLNCANLS